MKGELNGIPMFCGLRYDFVSLSYRVRKMSYPPKDAESLEAKYSVVPSGRRKG